MTSISSPHHQKLLDAVRETVAGDERFIGLLAGGSLLHGGFDEFSDLDLVLVVSEAAYDEVLAGRRVIAGSIGPLLAAFTGEHVGEPRLLICLYGDPPVHVDLKFVTTDALDRLIERPAIIWARTDAIEQRIAGAEIQWPDRPLEWFEERFWIWVHYATTKLGRGELFEALGILGFIREQVLGPLIHHRLGRPQRGVRRLEAQSPEWTERLRATVGTHDTAGVIQALNETVALYRELRNADQSAGHKAESVVTAYLESVIATRQA